MNFWGLWSNFWDCSGQVAAAQCNVHILRIPDRRHVNGRNPRGDGIAAVGALRRAARRHIPAVLITADRSRKVAAAAAAHDIHLLRKPVKPAALRAAMSHAAAAAEAAE